MFPYKRCNKNRDEFCNHIKNVPYHKMHKHISTFSSIQWKEPTELQSNEDITSKEGKGSAEVVVDTV